MRTLKLTLCIGLGWGLIGCQPEPPVARAPVTTTAPAQSAKPAPKVERAGIAPALQAELASDPLPDFAAITDTKAKKAAFFGYLRPLVLAENQRVMAIRDYLKLLQGRQKQQLALHVDDLEWLNQLSSRYRVDTEDQEEQVGQLLRKLHRLPVSLVLAQAANESAWGTSRFAREGNNLFGQWCFKPGCGMTPRARPDGETYEVAAFPNVAASVQAYFDNLNGNRSFSSLRKIRRCLLNNEEPLSGRALAAGLSNYSARGNHYVKELRSMMRHNELEPWTKDWWGNNEIHPCADLVTVQITKADPLLAQSALESQVKPEGDEAQPSPPKAPAEAAPPVGAVTPVVPVPAAPSPTTSAKALTTVEDNEQPPPAGPPSQS